MTDEKFQKHFAQFTKSLHAQVFIFFQSYINSIIAKPSGHMYTKTMIKASNGIIVMVVSSLTTLKTILKKLFIHCKYSTIYHEHENRNGSCLQYNWIKEMRTFKRILIFSLFRHIEFNAITLFKIILLYCEHNPIQFQTVP